ncbi:MAG: hypothetical protein FJZ01_01055 [Candidatus Sericytochromatia bacterium]|nr:hypothetical protein [Candidatus Tanganyikabacteria bacterium]
MGAYMYWAQNVAGHPGGPISVQKAIWLSYALATFYVMPAHFLADTRVRRAVRFVYGWFLLSWVARGAAELVLMYVWHAWIPPYGVYHGLFNLALVAWLMHRKRHDLAEAVGPADRTAVRYLAVIRLTQLAEITFALLFYQAVDFDTRDTWFAGEGQSRFAFINTLTAVVEAILLPLLAIAVWRYYRPAAPKAPSARSRTAAKAESKAREG